MKLETRPVIDSSFDILREFSERCRAELGGHAESAPLASAPPAPSAEGLAH